MSSAAALFEPFKLKSLNLENRIVMATMTRGFSPDGVPTDDVAAYYARRAAADGHAARDRTGAAELCASSNRPTGQSGFVDRQRSL